MHRVREHLRSNFTGDCSTRSLARRLGMSPSSLCHRFREAFGTTIGKEVRALRIESACELLRADPDRLLKEVAGEVGYANATYRTFLNAFRAETGVSPRRFAERAKFERLAVRLQADARRARRTERQEAAGAVPTARPGVQSRIRSA